MREKTHIPPELNRLLLSQQKETLPGVMELVKRYEDASLRYINDRIDILFLGVSFQIADQSWNGGTIGFIFAYGAIMATVHNLLTMSDLYILTIQNNASCNVL